MVHNNKKDNSIHEKLLADKLVVGYGSSVVVDDIQFSINAGEILALIGPNGSGKSTVLKTITKEIAKLNGDVRICGLNLDAMKEEDIATRMALLMTDRPSGELMSVRDMVATGRYPYTGRLGILSDKDNKVIDEAINLVSLNEIENTLFSKLSDGQKQCTMLARAFCQEPDILVLDEPTSFLDIHHKLELLELLKRMVEEKNMSVIMSLHELDLAEKCADYILCINDKKLVKYGTPEEVFTDDFINELYSIKSGTFLPQFGSVELSKASDETKVFVIGGGGSAINIYRRLQRDRTGFAAGIIPENDIEYPIVKSLANKVIAAKAYEIFSDADIENAIDEIKGCEKVICTLTSFGSVNDGNRKLRDFAQKEGKLETIDEVEKWLRS